MKKFHILSLIFISIFMFTACATNNENSTTEKVGEKAPLKVAVSIVPEATFVKAVAGDLVDVVTLIPPGNSPANYQPTPKIMNELSNASLYFSIGVPTEKANILPMLHDFNEDLTIVSLQNHVSKKYPMRTFEADEVHSHDEDAHSHDEDAHSHDEDAHSHDEDAHSHDEDAHSHDEDAHSHDEDAHSHDEDAHSHDEDAHSHDEDAHSHDEDAHSHKGFDPHIWMSPKRVIVMVEVIRDELIALDPENKKIYEKNATTYIDTLTSVDASLKEKFATIANKKFIMYHPSLGYFADDYGLEMMSIEKNGKSANSNHIEYVIEYAKEHGISVIFYQAEFDSSQAETIASEINGNTKAVDPLSSNYIDGIKQLGETFTN